MRNYYEDLAAAAEGAYQKQIDNMLLDHIMTVLPQTLKLHKNLLIEAANTQNKAGHNQIALFLGRLASRLDQLIEETYRPGQIIPIRPQTMHCH